MVRESEPGMCNQHEVRLSEAALFSLLRLSVETKDLVEQIEVALELIGSWSWLGLKPGGCVYWRDETLGDLRAIARCGLAVTLMLAPDRVSDDDRFWEAEVDREACGVFGRWEAFPDEFERGKHLPEPQVFSLGTAESRLGLLVLYSDSRVEERAGARELLRGVCDVLAGLIQRRRAEESLLDSQERFALAVRGTDAGIWDWNLRNNQVYFSPRWKSMLGYEVGEIRDHFDEWTVLIHPGDRERAQSALRDYFEGRSSEYELEHRLRHKDGSYRWILARGAVVRDVRGNPIRMVGSHLDITQRKREEMESQERISRMLIAQRIQQRLLPQDAPRVHGLEVAGASRPAEYTGGDLFDYFSLQDGKLGLCVADVSGHGYESALLMATTAARIRSYLEFPIEVDEVMARTNRALIRETDGERFVTMTMAWIDPATGHVSLINAGNPAGLVIDCVGRLKQRLPAVVPPLAVWAEDALPDQTDLEMEAGDLLVLFTDGILEAPWPSGRLAGEEEIVRAIAAVCDRPCDTIVDTLFEAAVAAYGESPVVDDLTTIVMRYLGPTA